MRYKEIPIFEAYEQMQLRVLREQIGTHNLPVADISHHHCMGHLSEEMIDKWVNKGKKEWEDHTNNIDMENKTKLHSVINKKEDPHQDLAHEHAMKLDRDHYYAIDAYVTGGLESGDDSGSKHLNQHLIDSHKEQKEPKKHFTFGSDDFRKTLHLDHLDDAIDRNMHQKKFVTYSGLGFNPKHLIKENNLLHLPAYTSSSSMKEVALAYAKPDEDYEHHVLEITHPKGSKGFYIGDNEDLSPFRQKEHLMPRNSTLKINPTPEEFHDVNGTRVNVWKATRLK